MVKPLLVAGVAALFASGFTSCKPDVKPNSSTHRYFELRQLIKADSAWLTQRQVQVVKTVSHNGEGSQTRQLLIKDWGRELAPFSASDLNKPAWRDSYTIQHVADSVIYNAKNSGLVTRRMVIQQSGGRIRKITIRNYTHNLLYQTTENLVYVPGSLYIIDKLQEVRLLGSNRYLIKGIIKK